MALGSRRDTRCVATEEAILNCGGGARALQSRRLRYAKLLRSQMDITITRTSCVSKCLIIELESDVQQIVESLPARGGGLLPLYSLLPSG